MNKKKTTCNIVETCLVENPWEEFESYYGVDENDKDDQEGDVKQGDHGHDDTIQDYLQTWEGGGRSSIMCCNLTVSLFQGYFEALIVFWSIFSVQIFLVFKVFFSLRCMKKGQS